MTEKDIFWTGCAITNVGLKRPNNEDNFLLDGQINENSLRIDRRFLPNNRENALWQYAGVFDGMGGGVNGEFASYIAALELQNVLQKSGKNTTEGTVETMIRQGFLNANQKIVEERARRSILGTTATVISFRKGRIKIFHLGDSRAYLLRGDRLYQLTRDQTLATLRIEAGCYDASSPEADRDSRLLMEYVGADNTKVSLIPTESEWINVRVTDKILLCSDGLYRGCGEKQMKEILLTKTSVGEMADGLVSEALNEGGEDNITCIVLALNEGRIQAGGR